jgi:DNA mismatch repair protein MutS2
MDAHTLELLEFAKIRAMVAARAACSLGQAAALRVEPSIDLGEIYHRQSLVTEMVDALGTGLKPPLGGVHDIEPQVRRAQTGAVLSAGELAQTALTLRAISDIDRWFARIGDQFPRLGDMRRGVGEFSGVAVAIEACLDNRGKVLDTASRRLSALRREIGRVQEGIQETLRQMLRSPEVRRVLRFPNFTMVGHHYVLPVAKDQRGEIQGSVLRTSASNETVYIEPASIGEHSAQLSFLRAREAKEIRRILRWLTAQVALVAEPLLGTLEIISELDLIHAQARLSVDYRMSPPQLDEAGVLVLKAARHPLLEAIFGGETTAAALPGAAPATAAHEPLVAFAPDQGCPARPEPTGPIDTARRQVVPEKSRTVVPIDLTLGARFHILVITGPNTGGKTVALKTVGLLALMAQCGLHVPADEGSRFPVFDDVLADIGDEQSLEQSLSTFSSHIRRISEIIRRATASSLVLMDELGAGTDPADGAALGRAILDELESKGARSIVTTHIGDLKAHALTHAAAENAAVEFDDQTLEPKYRLHIGDIGQSNALAIARHLQLPEHVVRRAESYLAERPSRGVPEWDAVQRLRAEAELARQAALQAQSDAERARDALAQRLAELEHEGRRADSVALARARLRPGDRVVVPRLGYDRPGRIVKLDERKKTAIVAIGHVTWNVLIEELVPQSFRQPEMEAQAPEPPAARKSRGRPVMPPEDDDTRPADER